MRTLLPMLTVAVLAVAGTAAVPSPDDASADAPSTTTERLAARGTSPPAATHARRRRRVCDRNYSGRCLRPNVSDYDCAGGSGNGPYYVRGPFRVVGTDHYRLDSDGDGVACES